LNPLTVFLIGIVVLALVLYTIKWFKTSKPNPSGADKAELNEAEAALAESITQTGEWTIVRQYHGPGYNHNVMLDIINKMAAEGIEATYDVIAAASAEMGVTNYVVKVPRQYETQANEFLEKLSKGEKVD